MKIRDRLSPGTQLIGADPFDDHVRRVAHDSASYATAAR